MAVAACSASVFADAPREVLQLKYTDGVIDYIPVADIDKITFSKGVDSESEAFGYADDMFNSMKDYMSLAGQHFDFGYPALMLAMDLSANDIYSPNSGYDHFRQWYQYDYRSTAWPSHMMWYHLYRYIRRANKVLATLSTPSTDEEKLLASQALAMRSFAYWNLVQVYAPNVSYEPTAPAVVISKATDDSAPETLPLATTTEVYDQIMSDIDLAISYLKTNDMAPAFLNVARSKRYIDLAVAYGLRARYNLTMHRYAEAASDARLAIDSSSARPLLPDAAAYPGFNDARLGNWMWAITIEETDRPVTSGIVNFGSFMITLATDGYVEAGVLRCCGDALWDWLSAQPDDVRNFWFLDKDNKGANLSAKQQELVDQVLKNAGGDAPQPHANIKFNPYRSKIVNHIFAEDIPLMRIEEMYLIEAEGLAMSGDVVGARNKLTEFVATYRNPSYECVASDMAGLQNEIMWQRRAEFWGEGLAYFDVMRLQLNIDRYTINSPSDYGFRIAGNSRSLIYEYPQNTPFIEGYDYTSSFTPPVAGEDWNY